MVAGRGLRIESIFPRYRSIVRCPQMTLTACGARLGAVLLDSRDQPAPGGRADPPPPPKHPRINKHHSSRKAKGKASSSSRLLPRASGDHLTIARTPPQSTGVTVRLTNGNTWDWFTDPYITMARNPSTGTAWGSFAAQYSEFKVLEMRLTVFCPWVRSPASNSPGCLVITYTNDSSSGPASYLAAIDNGEAMIVPAWGSAVWSAKLPPGRAYTMTSVVTSATADGEWTDCAAPSGLLGNATARLDATAPASIGVTVLYEWVVRFRGRE